MIVSLLFTRKAGRKTFVLKNPMSPYALISPCQRAMVFKIRNGGKMKAAICL